MTTTPPATPAAKPAAKGPAAKSTTPSSASAPAASKDAEAAERLEVARAKLASNLVDQAVADLRQILVDYPGSAAAVDAAFLAADALQKAGRPDDAMAMYVEFDRRFAGNPRVADSKLRRARLLQQTRNQVRQNEGYALYGEVARDFPRTPEARAALQARRQIESDRRQLRAIDPVLNVEVPALFVTLRMIADQFPGEAATMVALNQLALGYEDIDQFQAAVETLEHLAAQYPGIPWKCGSGSAISTNDASATPTRRARPTKRCPPSRRVIARRSSASSGAESARLDLDLAGDDVDRDDRLTLAECRFTPPRPPAIARRHRDVRLNRAVQRERHHARIGRRSGHL